MNSKLLLALFLFGVVALIAAEEIQGASESKVEESSDAYVF